MSRSKLATRARAILRKRFVASSVSRQPSSAARFSFRQDHDRHRRITREGLVTVRQVGYMKTNSIRGHTMKAVVGAVLAAAISTPDAIQAADQTAWDKTFPKSDQVEHRK